MAHTQVRRVRTLPFGADLLYDGEGGGLVVWVEQQRITEREAERLQDDLDREALARGRRLTVAEVLVWVPFVV